MIRRPALLLLATALSGCATTTTIPDDALRLPESTLEVRSIQTRTFEAPSEIEILTATIAVLQDMEFHVDRIEKPLGVITASKVTDADSASEKTTLFLLDMLCAASRSYTCENMSRAQDDQRITLTFVVLPSLEHSDQFSVRVTMQRVIYDKADRIKVLERIEAPEIYQQIFDNLRKSLYIQVSDK